MKSSKFDHKEYFQHPQTLQRLNNETKAIDDDIKEFFQIKEEYYVIYNTLLMIIKEKIDFNYIQLNCKAKKIYMTFLQNIDTDKNKILEYCHHQLPQLLKKINNLEEAIHDYKEKKQIIKIKLKKIEKFNNYNDSKETSHHESYTTI